MQPMKPMGRGFGTFDAKNSDYYKATSFPAIALKSVEGKNSGKAFMSGIGQSYGYLWCISPSGKVLCELNVAPPSISLAASQLLETIVINSNIYVHYENNFRHYLASYSLPQLQ